MNRAKIEDVLLAMGVPAGIKGFNYIADAIEIFDKRGANIFITKELYPAIAKKNNTTPSRAERAIRHAFERARSYGGNQEMVNHYIGMDNCKNSSSLKTLYIRIKQEIGEADKKGCVEETSKQENEPTITELEVREIIRQELRMLLNDLRETQT